MLSGLLLSAVLTTGSAFGQDADWQTLPNAPARATSRHNDVYFVTPQIGWVVNGAAEIWRTTDGGNSWRLQFSRSQTHLRSVAFVDSLRGWAGNVGEGEFGTTDPTPLYHTTNAGNTWNPVTTFDGPMPKGLCGMYVVNDSTVVGVGRVRGPAFFIRTTDAGQTWVSKDMSAYAAGLIDVHFFDPNRGFAVGLTNVNHEQSSGIVLYTDDGGATWEERFRTTRTGEWNWKISFPTPEVGYASLQRNSQSPIYFLKSTDGGATWEEKLFQQAYYFVQGIGFVNEREGWIGGNSTSPVYHTTDGGETWQPDDLVSRLNRMRFLSDTLGYAVGSTVIKYTLPSSVRNEEREAPVTFRVDAPHPNPFREETTLHYTLDEPSTVRVEIFDVQGRRVTTLYHATQPAGAHAVTWDGTDQGGSSMSAGTYLIRFHANSGMQAQSVVRLR